MARDTGKDAFGSSLDLLSANTHWSRIHQPRSPWPMSPGQHFANGFHGIPRSSKGFRRFPSVWLLVRSKCFTVNIYSFGGKKKTRRFLKIEPTHGLTLPPTSNVTSSRSNSSSRRCLLNSACGGTQLVSGPESLSSARASVESGVNRIGEVTKVHVRLCCCHSAFRLNDFQ